MEKDWGFNAENVLVGFDGSVSVKPVVYWFPKGNVPIPASTIIFKTLALGR